jgi:prophage antirepressor-like protein
MKLLREPELVPFVFDGHEVRTVMIDSEPWVNIGDVCDILELQNARRVARTLDAEDVRKVSTLAADGKQRRVYFTNEPGVYELTFRSNKPTARRLKRWLSHEVLPSIRKTGQFVLEGVNKWLTLRPQTPEAIFPDAYYDNILRLLKKPVDTPRTARFFGAITNFLVYSRIDQGVLESLKEINAIPRGRHWRPRKHHQHFNPGESTFQLRCLIVECVAKMNSHDDWEVFCGDWDSYRPQVRKVPRTITARIDDRQLVLFPPEVTL